MSNPTRDEGSVNGLSCYIWYRDGFRPTCEAVNAGEQLRVSSRVWEGSNKINVAVVKANVRVTNYRV